MLKYLIKIDQIPFKVHFSTKDVHTCKNSICGQFC